MSSVILVIVVILHWNHAAEMWAILLHAHTDRISATRRIWGCWIGIRLYQMSKLNVLRGPVKSVNTYFLQLRSTTEIFPTDGEAILRERLNAEKTHSGGIWNVYTHFKYNIFQAWEYFNTEALRYTCPVPSQIQSRTHIDFINSWY